MGKFFDKLKEEKDLVKEMKQAIKTVAKTAVFPIVLVIGIVIVIGLILSSFVYFLTMDDGTYKEGDWSNTRFVAEQYSNGMQLTQDGYLVTTKSINALWNDMVKNRSSITEYLNGPKEYLQMLYAEMVTQLPDLREDTSQIRTMKEWKEIFDNLEEEEGKFKTFHGSSGSGSGDFEKFELTDEEVRGLASVAVREQSGAKGAAAEASIMANLYERDKNQGYESVLDYVLNSPWFSTKEWYYSPDTNENLTPEAIEAVKSVLVDGKRTLPRYIDEHDCLSDLVSVTNDGVEIDKYDRNLYIPHKTIIKNRYTSTYTFYCFPTETSDPFGYTSQEAREQYGDDCYGESTSSSSGELTGYRTNIQGGIIRFTRNLITGETTLTDDEMNKMEYDYQNYKDDHDEKEAKQKEREEKKKEEEKENETDKKEEEKDNKEGEERRENEEVKSEGEGDKQEGEENQKENEGDNKDKKEGEDEEDDDDDEEEEELGPLLSFEEWMKQKGYTKQDNGSWKRKGKKISMSYVSPEDFDDMVAKYKAATTEKARDEAKDELMSHFTLVKGSGLKKSSSNSNSNVPTLDSMDGVLFIGDSITKGLEDAVTTPYHKITEEAREALKNSLFSAKVSTRPGEWLSHVRSPQPGMPSLPSDDKVKAICIMLGTNGPDQTKQMQELLEELQKKYPGKNIYVQKVLPVASYYDPGAFLLTPYQLNEAIKVYNAEMEKYCEDKDGIYFIDATDGYVGDDGYMVPSKTTDGVHIYGDFGTWAENIATIITGQTVGSSNCGTSEASSEDSEEDSEEAVEISESKLKADPDFTIDEQWRGENPYYKIGAVGVCTWFAWGKFYSVYGYSPGFTGDGVDCAKQLVEAHQDKFKLSDTPVPGAIFSWNNHVGMVTEVNGDEITIQDGNILSGPCNSAKLPSGESVTWRNFNTTVSAIKSAYQGVTFANPIDYEEYEDDYDDDVSRGEIPSKMQYKVKIATWEEETTSFSDPNGESQSAMTTRKINTELINYYDMVKQYTMPFDYLWILLTISNDRGFVFELLRTIYESDIEISINDKLTEVETTTNITYTITDKSTAQGSAVVQYWNYPTEEEVKEGKTATTGTATVSVGFTDLVVLNQPYSSQKYVHTITNSVDIGVARANVWIVDYIRDYIYDENTTDITTTSQVPDEVIQMGLQESDTAILANQACSKAPGSNPSVVSLNVTSGGRTRTKHDNVETVTIHTFIKGYKEGEKSLREKTGKAVDPEKLKNVKELRFNNYSGQVDIFDDINKQTNNTTTVPIEDTDEQTEPAETNTDEQTNIKEGNGEEQLETAEENNNEQTNPAETSTNEQTATTGDTQNQEEPIIGNNATKIVVDDSFIYREKNFVTLLCTYRDAKANIFSASSWLFELLEERETTIDFVDLTKYLLYKVSGDESWGTEFDFSIYDPDTFVDANDMDLCGDDVAEMVWYALVCEQKMSPEAVAGLLGNMACEAGRDLNPAAVQGGGSENNTNLGIGLCQWTADNHIYLKNYAKSKGKEWKDLDVQIALLIQDSKPGSRIGEPGMNGMGTSRTGWLEAKTPEEAAYQFEWWYERHQDGPQIERQTIARQYYDKYKDKKSSYFTKKKGKYTRDSKGNVVWKNTADYCQWDEKWQYEYSLGSKGCGPTSVAMAITTITGKKVTPVDVAKYTISNGTYNPGNGGARDDCIKAAASKWNLKSETVNGTSAIKSALRSGKVVCIALGPSPFYGGGWHYIALFGWKNGETFVRDPNNPGSVENGRGVGSKWWNLDTIMSYATTNIPPVAVYK